MEYLLLTVMIFPPLLLTLYFMRNRVRQAVPIDLGVVFSWIAFLYAWLPMVGITMAKHGFGVLQDSRIVNDVPTTAETLIVGVNYFLFISGFVLFYWQKKPKFPSIKILRGNDVQVFLALSIGGLIILASQTTNYYLGVEGGGTYNDSYAQVRQLPLFIQQITNGFAQIEFAARLAIIVFVISWRPRLHMYLAFAVVVFLIWAIFSGGSRTQGFLLAFAYLNCVLIYVRKIKPSYLTLLAIIGLLLFTFAGEFRASTGLNALGLNLFQSGEFVSLFINSVDLYRESMDGLSGAVPWQVMFVDLLRIFPQQILPFEKIDPAVWYASTYYPEFYDIGGGLAFGAITKSIIGFGITESFVKGALLGVLYAFVTNYCTSRTLTPMRAFVYTWFIVMSYQGIRDTTFSVFSRFIYQVAPIIFMLSIGYLLMRYIARQNSDEMRAASQ